MKTKLIVAVLAIVGALASALVLAATPPDSGPFITRVDAYQHVLEDGDLLIIGRYNIPYAVAPDETVTQTFFVQLLDGSNELARTSLYAYYNRGYGYGSFSIYLNASSAPTWANPYTIRLQGSPTLDWGGPVPFASTGSITWNASTSQAYTKVQLLAQLIAWADTLGDHWSVALTTTTAGGTKLSSYGEAYFTNVIPGLRTMCPLLFSASTSVPSYEGVTWTQEGTQEHLDAWPFDFSGMSGYVGLPTDSDEVFRSIGAFIIIFLIGAIMIKYGASIPLATFACFALMWVLTIPGAISLTIAGGITFVLILLAGAVFLLRLT